MTLAKRYEDAVEAQEQADAQLTAVEDEIVSGSCGPNRLAEWKARLGRWIQFLRNRDTKESRSKKGKGKAPPDNPYIAAEHSRTSDSRFHLSYLTQWIDMSAKDLMGNLLERTTTEPGLSSGLITAIDEGIELQGLK